MISDINGTQVIVPIPVLRLAFRPFFLCAAIFSVFAIAAWAAVLFMGWRFLPYGGSYWWHAHEMLFGFVAAVVAGFLLTAVQSWTGVPGIKGHRLLVLVSLWLLARVLMAVNLDGLHGLAASADLLFLPAVAACLASSVLKVKQYRNLIFLPLLLGMTVCNIYMHLAVLLKEPVWLQTGSHAMVMMVTAIMCVLGGRVFPMFTANGTSTPKVEPVYWLEKLALLSVGLLAALFLMPVTAPRWLLVLLLLVGGFSHLIRWFRWRFWITLKTPLVWSLHSAYICIPLGLLLLALHYSTESVSFSLAMHVITVGAMGGMILSMMSRVSLGHTGRMINVGYWMTSAFVLILMAMLSRTVLLAITSEPKLPLLLSALFWGLSYGMFVAKYFPILTQPRADGKNG